MGTIIVWILYIAATAGLLGLMAILTLWLRWAVLCFYALLPATLAVWICWMIIALPINILFDGWAFEKKVVKMSHWLNDATLSLWWFAICLPFKAIAWCVNLLYWMVC